MNAAISADDSVTSHPTPALRFRHVEAPPSGMLSVHEVATAEGERDAPGKHGWGAAARRRYRSCSESRMVHLDEPASGESRPGGRQETHAFDDALTHGDATLPSVTVDAYAAELRDGEGFVGDRASSGAFHAILDVWRERMRAVGEDPFGGTPTEDISTKELDEILLEGSSDVVGVVHSAVEDFANELARVTSRFLALRSWKDTERIVVGGGLRASRVGEIAIGRASVLLKRAGHAVAMSPIHRHPDEAGLLGAVHLVPARTFRGFDAILAVDIGGSTMRAGVVAVPARSRRGRATVERSEMWRYGDEAKPPSREAATEHLGAMLLRLLRWSKRHGKKLAPFVGVACPGVIAKDGSIARGGQNLPGNWESSRFHLPSRIAEMLPSIGVHETTVVMHNDAVVQGLSELPFLDETTRWAVLTIGTGLGNARFTTAR